MKVEFYINSLSVYFPKSLTYGLKSYNKLSFVSLRVDFVHLCGKKTINYHEGTQSISQSNTKVILI